RFLVGDKILSFTQIGEILREAYPDRKLPKGELPSWLVRMLTVVNPALKQILPELEKERSFSNEKSKRMLGLDYIPAKEAVLASTNSLIDLGEL
ncbi:MAG: aldehyde reductase, partial [Pseudomonadota bacterium]